MKKCRFHSARDCPKHCNGVQPISLHVDECAFYVLIRKPAHHLEKEKKEPVQPDGFINDYD